MYLLYLARYAQLQTYQPLDNLLRLLDATESFVYKNLAESATTTHFISSILLPQSNITITFLYPAF